MAKASYLQTNFLGGQWTTGAQGRADDAAYQTGMNRSYNALPVEAGGHTRRAGSRWCNTTRGGVQGLVRSFDFSESQPFTMEFTAAHLRLYLNRALLTQNPHVVSNVSTANPAVVQTAAAHGYSTGDEVLFSFTALESGKSPAGIAILLNRVFLITKIDSYTFSLQDSVTGANVDGSSIALEWWEATVAKVTDFSTPYALSDITANNIRVVQDEDTAFTLSPTQKPYVLQNTANSGITFSYSAASFLDGPYLDPPTDGSTLTASAASGSVTLTASSAASINNGQGFLSTDVGRHVRLLSEPADWASGTAYVAGNTIRYMTGSGPAYYLAVTGSTGVQPDTDDGTHWAITTTAANWTWAIITAVTDTTHVTATIQASATDVYLQPLAGGALVNGTRACAVWRLGAWSNTTGWPTNGCFHKGRFYFVGPGKNEFAATMSDENFNFAPTLLDGTVADNCGLAFKLKAGDTNTIYWAVPAAEGVLLGTIGGEWLVQASTLNEPITPTSIDANKVTKYGCFNTQPQWAGMSYLFVQRYNKQVYEYLADVYSRKFSGSNIARRARGLTGAGGGVVEIAYQFENAPVLWARRGDGVLLGCTYKRDSPFATQPASFFGWHYHGLGSGRVVESLTSGPAENGVIDAPMMVTNDTATNVRYVEQLSPVLDESQLITDALFVDAASGPVAAEIATVSGRQSLILYGAINLAGKTVSVFAGGIDAGDYVVSATGTVTIPLDGSGTGAQGGNTADALLTAAFLQTVSNAGLTYALGVNIQVTPPGQGYFSPYASAVNYVMANNYNAHLSTNAAQSCFDWDNNVAYFRATTLTDQHVEALNIKTQATIWDTDLTSTSDHFGSAGGAALGPDGHIYYGTITSSYLVNRFNTTTKATDLIYNDTHSLQGRSAYIAAFYGSDGYVYTASVSINSGNTGGSESSLIDVVQMTGAASPTYVTSLQPAEVVTGGIASSNVTLTRRGPTSSVYALALASGAASMGFYRVTVEGPSAAGLAKLATLTPSQVHSGETTFTLTEPIYDETDGNVLWFTTGSSGQSYLVKLNGKTGAVMWSLAISGFYDMHESRVRGGRISVFGASAGGGFYDLYLIDTIAGSITTHVTENAISNAGGGNNATDDKVGQMIIKVNDTTNNQWSTFGAASGGGAITPAVVYNAPAVLGFNYQSQGQILRQLGPQETGAQNGPALGKTRRQHQYAALLQNTQKIEVGTDFTHMRAARLWTAGRTQVIANNVLFSDVLEDTLDDDYSFHSMWAWQSTRPYPATVVTVEGFIQTQDR